jgi:hypothetical protein
MNSRFKLTNQETQQEKCRTEASGWPIRMLKNRKTGRNLWVSQSGVSAVAQQGQVAQYVTITSNIKVLCAERVCMTWAMHDVGHA